MVEQTIAAYCELTARQGCQIRSQHIGLGFALGMARIDYDYRNAITLSLARA